MNTHIDLLGMHISMASRARRRALVVFYYAALAAWIAGFCSGTRSALLLVLPLMIALFLFAGYAGTGFEGGDEREIHRRDHAFFIAYQKMTFILYPGLFIISVLGPNSLIVPLFDLPYRKILEVLPFGVVFALIGIYPTLPNAIILWTEPDLEEKPVA
jgi:uncharacterized membrane protein